MVVFSLWLFIQLREFNPLNRSQPEETQDWRSICSGPDTRRLCRPLWSNPAIYLCKFCSLPHFILWLSPPQMVPPRIFSSLSEIPLCNLVWRIDWQGYLHEGPRLFLGKSSSPVGRKGAILAEGQWSRVRGQGSVWVQPSACHSNAPLSPAPSTHAWVPGWRTAVKEPSKN